MRLALVSALAAFALTQAAPARAEDLLKGLRIVVPKAAGEERWGTGKVTRAVRRELTSRVGDLLNENDLSAAMDTLGLKGEARTEAAGLAKACRALNGQYVVQLVITKKRWLYTARGFLVNCSNDEVQMDFRSEYFKPDVEAEDRGLRIGRKVLQKLELLLSPQPPAQAVTATIAQRPTGGGDTPPGGVPPGEAPPGEIGGGGGATDTPPGEGGGIAGGGEADPFAGLSLDSSAGAGSEFDGFSDEGGWTWSVRGWIGTTYEAFLHPDVDPSKDRNFVKLGIRTTLTGQLGQRARLRVLPLVELDVTDSRLHRVVLEEGFLEVTFDDVEFRAGFDALSWGAASTVNIIDVINTRDFTEGIADAPKVGQPLFSARILFGNHSLTLMYLTPFIAPSLPRCDSVFSPFACPMAPPGSPPGFNVADVKPTIVYGSKLDEWNPQAAARLVFALGPLDLRASYFYGFDRFPQVHLPTGTLFFPLIHNASTDGQYLIEQLTLKWELASTWWQRTDRSRMPPITLANGLPAEEILLPDQRFSFIVGAEYNFEQVIGQTNLLAIAEVIADSDSRWFTDDTPPDVATRFFTNHISYGFRWTFENRVDSKLSVLDLMDLRQPTDHLISLEYSERWFKHFTFALGGRLGLAEEGHPMAVLKQLSGIYTQLRLNY